MNRTGINNDVSPTGSKDLKIDSTLRFSERVEQYVRYRPGYPREVIDLLVTECGHISPVSKSIWNIHTKNISTI